MKTIAEILAIMALIVLVTIGIMWITETLSLWKAKMFPGMKIGTLKKVLNIFQKKNDDIVISKSASYALGIITCLCISLVITLIIGLIIPSSQISNWYKWPILIMVLFGLLGGTISFLFVGQIQKIDVAHRALLFFLDDYISDGKYVLGIGKYWVPSFISVRAVQVLVNERVTNFPPQATDEPFTVETLSEGTKEETGGKSTLRVRCAVRWRPIRSRTFYDFTEGQGDAKVIDGIRNRVIAHLRQEAALMTNEEFIRSKDLIANGGKDKKGLVDVLNEVSVEKWGVKCEEVIISKAQDDEEVEAAREKYAREKK